MAAPAITHDTAADGTFSAAGATHWNANHTLANFSAASKLLGAGSAAATPDEITLGTGLSMSGTTLTASGTAVVFADAPNSNFDMTNGGAGGNVTFVSKSVTGIVVGDQVEIEMQATIFNNSGAGRTYTFTANAGALSITIIDNGTRGTHATGRSMEYIQAVMSVSATNLALLRVNTLGTAVTVNSGGTGALATNQSKLGWATSSNDLTGSQTISLQVSSDSTTATQTLTLHSYKITRISTV